MIIKLHTAVASPRYSFRAGDIVDSEKYPQAVEWVKKGMASELKTATAKKKTKTAKVNTKKNTREL